MYPVIVYVMIYFSLGILSTFVHGYLLHDFVDIYDETDNDFESCLAFWLWPIGTIMCIITVISLVLRILTSKKLFTLGQKFGNIKK